MFKTVVIIINEVFDSMAISEMKYGLKTRLTLNFINFRET